MFLDSSVLMAILLQEPGAEDLVRQIMGSKKKPTTSPVVRYEVVVSLARSRRGGQKITPEDTELAAERYDELLKLLDATEAMITPNVARQAVQAASTYGKVAGHPADLNMGDCFSYAMASAYKIPLLYKGNDFAKTDLG